jgi:hypothetical protein
MSTEESQKDLSGRNQASVCNDLLERRLVLDAVDREPEYPGGMPDGLWESIVGDRDAMEQALILTVRLTKQGIRNRIKAL